MLVRLGYPVTRGSGDGREETAEWADEWLVTLTDFSYHSAFILSPKVTESLLLLLHCRYLFALLLFFRLVVRF